jgi:tetratricopeptide (TPR) repeat protein
VSKASQIRQKAQEYLSKGQIEKAIGEYKRLISVESKNPNLYNELGDTYLRAADKQQAVQNFEKAAAMYEKVALYNNAVAVCKKILRVEPEEYATIFKLGELRAKQKLEGEAVTYFSQYVDYLLANPQTALSKSQKEVERILELMPSSEPIIDRATEVYEQLGMKLKAAELLAKLSTIAVENGDAEKHRRYARRLEDIKSSLSPEEAQAANVFVSAAAEAGQETAASEAAPESAGGATVEAQTVAEEEAPPRDADSDVPISSEPREEAPATESEEGLDSAAREAVEEAEMLAAMSGGDGAYAASASGGTPGTAARDAISAPTTVGDESRPAPPKSVSPETDAGPRADRRTDMERELVEEITSDVEKDDLKSHYDLGMAYCEMGLYTEAIKDFQIASRCEELKLSCMEMIGHCFLKQENPRLAVKQLAKALEIAKASGSESLGIHYNLGLAHELLGELDKAREHFEEVYIVDMTFRDVAEKMRKLSTVS